MIVQCILLLLFTYFFLRNTQIDRDKKVRFWGVFSLVVTLFFQVMMIHFMRMDSYYLLAVVLVQMSIYLMYLIFYNNDVLSYQMRWFIPFAITYSVSVLFFEQVGWLAIFCFIVTRLNKGSKQRKLKIVELVFIGLMSYMMVVTNTNILVPLLVIIFDQYTLLNDSENEKSMGIMQEKFLSHQYEEIKNVYLNMRGWRHDYHNHIQAMKAYIHMNEIDELKAYLLKLEKELDSVDRLVKSGNIMMDAILNSKITIMMQHEIDVNVKAMLKDDMPIGDIDLCVMVSNLLENAIEACLELPKEKRFIRIYSDIQGTQFYLSIQNSGKEVLDFNERHYISTKRGEHGLGMKRVQFLVSRYEGYLNLQNEPGIFASEISIPLRQN